MYIGRTLSNLGQFVRLMFGMLAALWHWRLWLMQSARQVHIMGIQSLVLIVWSSIFIGFVFTLQMYKVLSQFSSLSQLSSMVAYGIFRELGPVITGLLMAGRVGSTVAAELCLMQQTEQINALEMMGISPQAYLLLPRFLMAMLVTPVLVYLFDASSILASGFLAVDIYGMESEVFWNPLSQNISWFKDIIAGGIKGVMFAVIIIFSSFFHGLYAGRGSQGMAVSSTQSVVVSSLLILASDYALSTVLY